MALALVLAVLTQRGAVTLGHVYALAFLLGLVNALDMPTRQAFVVELVREEDLQNAIALNSAAFNTARLVGPAVAGLAIARVGLAGCFYLNALSFVAVLVGLLAVQGGRRSAGHRLQAASVWEDLHAGLRYAIHTPVVLRVIVLVAVVGTFGMNMSVLLPLLARQGLQVGAEGFGMLTSAMGIGSLAAAVLLAYSGDTPRRHVVIGSALAVGVLEMLLAGVQTFAGALAVLAAIGFAMISFTTLANTVLQATVPDVLRGRVMSLYTTVFAGTTPIGSMVAGGLAAAWGVRSPLFLGGLVSAVTALAFFRLPPSAQHRALAQDSPEQTATPG
jgi:predicted MFS family arabinose efflux permease